MKKQKEKSKEYRQGFTDGYSKAMKDFRKIRKESEERMKPIREALNRLRDLR